MNRYEVLSSDVTDFFRSEDRNRIHLSASAALEVSERAAENGLRILGIEGGKWGNPGFEARLDSLWSGRTGDLDEAGIRDDNRLAAEFIRQQSSREDDFRPDVFVLTTRETP